MDGQMGGWMGGCIDGWMEEGTGHALGWRTSKKAQERSLHGARVLSCPRALPQLGSPHSSPPPSSVFLSPVPKVPPCPHHHGDEFGSAQPHARWGCGCFPSCSLPVARPGQRWRSKPTLPQGLPGPLLPVHGDARDGPYMPGRGLVGPAPGTWKRKQHVSRGRKRSDTGRGLTNLRPPAAPSPGPGGMRQALHSSPGTVAPLGAAPTEHPRMGSGPVPTPASGTGALHAGTLPTLPSQPARHARLGAMAAPACPSASDRLVPSAPRGQRTHPPRATAAGARVPGQGHPTGRLLAHLHSLGELMPPTQGTQLWSPRLRPAWWHRGHDLGSPTLHWPARTRSPVVPTTVSCLVALGP